MRRKIKREQPRKDSRSKRVNFDNERESKFAKDMHECKGEASNDVSWYARSTELLNSAGSIAFSQTTGMSDANGNVVPGVMVLPFVSSLGGLFNDPINQAKDSIYSYTVHGNSRNISYSANDQMMIILGAKECFNAISALIRVYGLMLRNNQENWNIPDTLFTAMGFDPDDLRSSYNTMLYDINLLITDTRQLWIPNTMPVFHREFWMSTNIYMDSESPKGQLYFYMPAAIRVYDDTSSSSGSMLVPSKLWTPLTGMTWATAVKAVRQAISALVRSTDRGVIMGDILKAYGEDKIFKLNYVDPNYETVITYDKEVLTQIENLTFMTPTGNPSRVPIPSNWCTYFKATNTNGLISEVQASFTTGLSSAWTQYFPPKCALNFHFKGQPTPADVMVATRMSAIGNAAIAGPDVGNPTTIVGNMPRICGTEWCVFPAIYTRNANGTITKTFMNQIIVYASGASTIDFEYLNRISALTAFDWSPWMYMGIQSGNTATSLGSLNITKYVADVDNYIILTESELQRLHTSAILSEFGVPVLN